MFSDSVIAQKKKITKVAFVFLYLRSIKKFGTESPLPRGFWCNLGVLQKRDYFYSKENQPINKHKALLSG